MGELRLYPPYPERGAGNFRPLPRLSWGLCVREHSSPLGRRTAFGPLILKNLRMSLGDTTLIYMKNTYCSRCRTKETS